MTAKLDGGELDTLIALVESGPLWDGDVPSKAARDSLIARGFAVRIMFKCSDGYQAATYAGRDAYKEHFGNADTVAEARSNRYAAQVVRTAKAKPTFTPAQRCNDQARCAAQGKCVAAWPSCFWLEDY